MLKELANAADSELGPKFLHIVVKLADIESVYFNTASGRELQFDQNVERRPRSALTAALADSPRKENAPEINSRCKPFELTRLSSLSKPCERLCLLT